MRDILQSEMNQAYNMIQGTFNIDFVLPDLYYGPEHFDKFHDIRSIRDFAQLPEMVLDYELNGIYVSEQIIQKSSDERIYAFLHELGHAMVDQNSVELNWISIDELVKSNIRLGYVQGYVYCAVTEGLADYIAMKSAANSETVKKLAINRATHLEESFLDWISGDDLKNMAKGYSIRDSDWQKIVIRYFTGSPEFLNFHSFPYIIGHHFLSNLGEINLEELMRNPPVSIEELIYPERYCPN